MSNLSNRQSDNFTQWRNNFARQSDTFVILCLCDIYRFISLLNIDREDRIAVLARLQEPSCRIIDLICNIKL